MYMAFYKRVRLVMHEYDVSTFISTHTAGASNATVTTSSAAVNASESIDETQIDMLHDAMNDKEIIRTKVNQGQLC